VTTTSTDAAACAGVTVVIVVLLTTVTLVTAEASNVTVAPVAKFAPVSVTAVPPVIAPPSGLTRVTVGGGTKLKQPAHVLLWLSTLLTTTSTSPPARAG